MEWRRRSEADDAEWEPLKRGWCIGSEEFKREMLGRMEEGLGGNHSGELRRESADAKAGRIIREELQRLGWNPSELAARRKGDPAKLAIANRLRRKTVLPITAIAEKLHLGSPKSARARLREHQQQARVGTGAQARTENQRSPYEDVALL